MGHAFYDIQCKRLYVYLDDDAVCVEFNGIEYLDQWSAADQYHAELDLARMEEEGGRGCVFSGVMKDLAAGTLEPSQVEAQYVGRLRQIYRRSHSASPLLPDAGPPGEDTAPSS